MEPCPLTLFLSISYLCCGGDRRGVVVGDPQKPLGVGLISVQGQVDHQGPPGVQANLTTQCQPIYDLRDSIKLHGNISLNNCIPEVLKAF